MEIHITLKTWKLFEEDLKSGEHGFLLNAQGAPFSDMLIIPKGADNVILIQKKQAEFFKRYSSTLLWEPIGGFWARQV